MGELLLITDDPRRAEGIAHEFGGATTCCIHDLYDDRPPASQPDLIVSDIEALTSDAIVRLRRILRQVHKEQVPYLFLMHGNAARAEAQAQALGASKTMDVTAGAQQLLDALAGLQERMRPTSTAVQARAVEVRQYFRQALFSGKPITPSVAKIGTDLVIRAVRDSGVRDWIRTVQRFDNATHQHCLLVAALAAAFSDALGLRAVDCERLTKAALLHDVGKIHVPPAILNKPGKLTVPERALMNTHPARGYDMLVGHGFADDVLAVVHSHHEMLDGSGYPDGLKGADIPDLVRLVTVCDIYGALIEHRSYKPPMPGEKAYDILQDMVGRLDADLVRAFRPVAAAFDPGVAKAA